MLILVEMSNANCSNVADGSDMGKYEDTRKGIRKGVECAQWKYLRESSKARSFNCKMHTSLDDYLGVIFPTTDDWVYNASILDSIQHEIAGEQDMKKIDKRIKPDAFSKNLSLIIEFDGIDHYAKPLRVIKDKERDMLFRRLCIDTVRIPYWIQLSKANINFLFSALEFSSARVHMDREMCELKYSFFDDGKTDFGLSISPAAMCPLGFKRFCDEVVRYPTETQRILRDDLSLVSDACMEKFGIEAAMKDFNPLFAE